MIFYLFLAVFFLLLAVVTFCIFFDQAVFTRRGTIYRIKTHEKKVAITFDDGPSPIWTPLILDELKKAQVKATFFMIGHHVQKYPEVARRVAEEGHSIGNHGYAHTVIFYYTPAEIEEEIKYTEHVIREITGVTTKIFRPPKAWVRPHIKKKIFEMGYQVVLWSLNSKDWVMYHHLSMVNFITSRIRGGDIILFHDSGSVVSLEGGDRSQTVRAIQLLVEKLKGKGFQIVPLEELMDV